MRIKNDQAGLTLVELLVTIVVASIVTLAACTMLLFGLRINNQSTKTSMGQNTVQVLMEALEDVAAEAKDLNVESDADSWAIKDGTQTLFSYESAHQTIYTGPAMEGDLVIGTPFLKGIFASSVEYKNQLLTIDVQITEEDNYSTSIYCRMGKEETPDSAVDDLIAEIKKLDDSSYTNTFLKKLVSQHGSRGEINYGEGSGTFKYYSEWYVGVQNYTGHPNWNKNTPWCACFVSWAMAQVKNVGMPKEAHVDKLMEHFSVSKENLSVGSLVFFNLDDDEQPDHVGVVIKIDNGYIYTIEGNTAGQVGIRKYAATNNPRIMGYGSLNWNS